MYNFIYLFFSRQLIFLFVINSINIFLILFFVNRDRLEEPFKDKQPHLYTLIVNPDNTYVIKVDHRIVNEGSLLTDFTPAVNPPKEIDDPTDTKPIDWDEREKVAARPVFFY